MVGISWLVAEDSFGSVCEADEIMVEFEQAVRNHANINNKLMVTDFINPLVKNLHAMISAYSVYIFL